MAWFSRSTLYWVNKWEFISLCSLLFCLLLHAEAAVGNTMDKKKINECSILSPTVVFCGVLWEVPLYKNKNRENQRQLRLPKEYRHLVKTRLLNQTTFLGNKQRSKIRPIDDRTGLSFPGWRQPSEGRKVIHRFH